VPPPPPSGVIITTGQDQLVQNVLAEQGHPIKTLLAAYALQAGWSSSAAADPELTLQQIELLIQEILAIINGLKNPPAA
jgi:hypothetical protein